MCIRDRLRPVQPSDFQAVLDLIIAFDVAVLGVPDTTEDDLRTNWQQPRFNPATDAWVAVSYTHLTLPTSDLV